MDMVDLLYKLGNWEKINFKLKDDMFSYTLSSQEDYQIRIRLDYLVSLLEKEVNTSIKFKYSDNNIQFQYNILRINSSKKRKSSTSKSSSISGKTVILEN